MTRTAVIHSFRVACDEHTVTARTAEQAQKLLDTIESLGACHSFHHVEENVAGQWVPAGTTVRLADGTEVRIAWSLRDRFRGLDADGNQVVTGDWDTPAGEQEYRYPLTPCCHATGKGSAGSPTGVCCRACYRTVASYFGGPAQVAPGKAVER